jgi:hypothetical protein
MTNLHKFSRIGRFHTALLEAEDYVNALMNSLKVDDLNEATAIEQLKPYMIKLHRISGQESSPVWG